ncbi:hypothetical protein RI367_003023 [Sorochytrium milnesiophthora]
MNNTTADSLADRIARQPPEVVTYIVAHGGVRTCAILRHHDALRAILRGHNKRNDRYAPEDRAALQHCIDHRWSAGVRLLIEYGNYQLAGWADSVAQLDGIVLTPAIIKLLWRRQPLSESKQHLACLVYNLAAAGRDATGLVQWCYKSSRAFLPAYAECIMKHGATLQDLRGLYQLVGGYDGEYGMAYLLAASAARSHRVDLLKEFAAIDPLLLYERPSLLLETVVHPGGLETVQYLHAHTAVTFPIVSKATTHAENDSGALDVAGWLKTGDAADVSAIYPPTAAYHGRVDVVETQLARGLASPVEYEGVAREAAQYGRLPVLRMLFDTRATLDSADCYNTELLLSTDSTKHWKQFTRQDRVDLVHQLLSFAAGAGHLATVQWLTGRFPQADVSEFVLPALSGGHVEVAQYLLDHAPHRLDTTRVYDEQQCRAIQSGRLDALQLLGRHFKMTYSHRLLGEAIDSGNLDVARYVYGMAPRVRMALPMLDTAVQKGSLAMVQWAFSKVSASLQGMLGSIDAAASAGNLEIVRWLNENTACRCTTQAMDRAAALGRLDIVQYLDQNREEGCTTDAMDNAAAGGFLDVVGWLHEHRTEGCTTAAMDAAAERGFLDVVRYLHEHRSEGCTTEAMNAAAREGWLDVVQFLHAHRFEGCTTRGVVEAAVRGDLAVVRWFQDNRPEMITSSVARHAAQAGSFSVVKYLHAQGYPMPSPADLGSQVVRDWLLQNVVMHKPIRADLRASTVEEM